MSSVCPRWTPSKLPIMTTGDPPHSMRLLVFGPRNLEQSSRQPNHAAFGRTTNLRTNGAQREANYTKLSEHTQASFSGGNSEAYH
jgi:hypothetical protein